MSTITETPELPPETIAVLNNARAAVREAKRVAPGVRVHALHSQMHGVQMHIDSIVRDNNQAALSRLPHYVKQLRQTLAQIRGV
ncbi:hypothetical protein [Blastopirellula retiformator]|uniref:Uncharacterized protein n=1 Tax=Blastopirellula retiformator TaxID=2527970 RepID=A0A5C5VJC6_9BACT|nr:hypothetical protein [Blastopirellula retiformator]TWT38698.1 hypothetical protein Enr8_03920 [Blastopirellula retiformator]